VNDSDEEMS